MSPVTLDSIFSGISSTGGRSTNAVCETLRLMEKWMPSTIKRANEQYDLKLPDIKGYYLAGVNWNDEFPVIAVGHSTSAEMMANRVDQDHINITVNVVYSHIENEKQLLDCIDLCHWVRAVIFAHRGYHQDETGLPCWKGLAPGGFAPARAADCMGYGYSFTAWQPGGLSGQSTYWKAAP